MTFNTSAEKIGLEGASFKFLTQCPKFRQGTEVACGLLRVLDQSTASSCYFREILGLPGWTVTWQGQS